MAAKKLPLPSPHNGPLLALLKDIGLTERQLRAILRDGAEEAERLIPKLIEQNTTGSKLKAAQTAIVLRELRAMMSALWGDIGPAITDGVKQTVLTAAQGEDILFQYMGSKGKKVMQAAFTEQARSGIPNILAKASNNIPLARSVYQTQALATGLVHRKVNNGLLLGHSAKRIAKDVKGLIDPNVAGGVSYAAMRLARTELNNAFKSSQELRYRDEPWTKGMAWNLSKSHPEKDECDEFAEEDEHGLGAGVYAFGHRPFSHPNCLCYLTVVQVDEDEFIDAFMDGEYNEFLDEKAYTHAPPGMLPC